MASNRVDSVSKMVYPYCPVFVCSRNGVALDLHKTELLVQKIVYTKLNKYSYVMFKGLLYCFNCTYVAYVNTTKQFSLY